MKGSGIFRVHLKTPAASARLPAEAGPLSRRARGQAASTYRSGYACFAFLGSESLARALCYAGVLRYTLWSRISLPVQRGCHTDASAKKPDEMRRITEPACMADFLDAQ